MEATVRVGAELGHEVTVVKDATADYSDEEMPAAFDVNIPNYASAIVSTDETAASLRGKVVLISFWTYTCINWMRSLPYVRAWASKYADHGWLVIGVHTPEFSFEKDLDNVRRAATDGPHGSVSDRGR